MLYSFEKLKRKLDQLGFPQIQSGSGFQIIKGIDFEEAYKSGSISFEEDGIYLEYEEKKYRGYMFIKEPWITVHDSYPSFHLTKCKTIDDFISKGKFKTRYEWANSNVVDLIDITTKKIFKDEILNYCGNCKKALLAEISDTQNFFDSLDKTELEEDKIEVDIFGYVRGKERISKAYRAKKNYTCEQCGVTCKTSLHRRWWHTHHKDGNKTNNSEANLECLCVCCHSRKDEKHQLNFSKDIWQSQVKSFVDLYRQELTDLNSPCI